MISCVHILYGFKTKSNRQLYSGFYCNEARLIIELDGSQHYEEKGLLKDKIRTEKIESRNLTVIRIPNNEINNNFRAVCEYIDSFVNQTLHR